LTLDHVVPISRNGKKDWNNIVTACRPCNQKKGNKTPHAAKMPLLSEPKPPGWLPSIDYELNPQLVPSNWHPYLRLDPVQTK
jgi:5-methylcytosine-specific restriction endonuclease McrA